MDLKEWKKVKIGVNHGGERYAIQGEGKWWICILYTPEEFYDYFCPPPQKKEDSADTPLQKTANTAIGAKHTQGKKVTKRRWWETAMK